MLELSTGPTLRPSVNPLTHGVEAEMERLPHLSGDRRHTLRGVRRNFRDARKIKSAAEAIGELPQQDEALHLAVSGRFALWHMVPAALSLARCGIAELRIATLGFSQRNISDLCGLLDAGKVAKTWLLCSHYFKGTSGPAYQFASDELGKRKSARFLSLRTHAKLLLMRFTDGRTISVESSANLRSCKNIEQMTLIGCPAVYDFHVGWMDELFQ